MEEWGYFLIASGVVWIFAKFFVETFRPKSQTEPLKVTTAEGGNVFVDVEGLAKLAATAYGPGLTLALLGVVLVLGANGFSVNVGTDTATPTPAPAPADQFPFPLPTLPTPPPLPTPTP